MSARGRERIARGAALAALLLPAALGLADCSREAQKPPPQPQSLIGLSKERLLTCAGQPAADYQQAGLEYMTYRTKTKVGEGYLQSLPRIPVVGSLGMGGPGYEITCEARIVLKEGTMIALTLAADPVEDAETTRALCQPMLGPCFPP